MQSPTLSSRLFYIAHKEAPLSSSVDAVAVRHLRADTTVSRHPKNPANFVASWAVFNYLLLGT